MIYKESLSKDFKLNEQLQTKAELNHKYLKEIELLKLKNKVEKEELAQWCQSQILRQEKLKEYLTETYVRVEDDQFKVENLKLKVALLKDELAKMFKKRQEKRKDIENSIDLCAKFKQHSMDTQ